MQRRRHSDELKARVVLETLRGVDTANVIAKRYGVHPLVVSKWKKHAVSLLPTLFSRRKDREKEDWERREGELFQEIGRLKYELDWLKKNRRFSLSEFRQCIDPTEPGISIVRQCRLFGHCRSSWYRTPQEGESEENLLLMHMIDAEYTAHPFYGSRQMRSALRRRGYEVNRKRMQRLMRIMGLEAIYAKPRLSKPGAGHRTYPYLLRGVAIERPDQVWRTDITYVRLHGGFAYLVALIDWYSRYVLAFEMSVTMDHQFCLSALRRALEGRRPEIHNSDQGAQFTCREYLEAVLEAGIRVSMDGRGRALDNVFVERLWRTVKYEDIYLKDYHSVRDCIGGLKTYFAFYNHERPHSSLGGATPAEVYFR